VFGEAYTAGGIDPELSSPSRVMPSTGLSVLLVCRPITAIATSLATLTWCIASLVSRMDWSKARDRTIASKAMNAEPRPFYPPKPKRAKPFAQTYAAYVNRCKSQGVKPLAPIPWIASLKA
jgi:hypothetical protein